MELHHGTCFGKESRPIPLYSLVIGDIISTSVPNNSIVNLSVTIPTHSTLRKSPKWLIGIRWSDHSLLSLWRRWKVLKATVPVILQSEFTKISSYGFTCFLFKSKRRTYCYFFFPRRFFLSSIEAAVEHIRGGYVNDVLKGLSPAKVCIVFVWKIIWDRVANKKNG